MARTFNNKNVILFRKMLRNNMTKAEIILWKKLRRRQILNTRFRRQVSIGNYIADFFSFDVYLAIEVDGKDHDRKEKKEYDEVRTEVIETQNVSIIRFKNEDVIKNIDKVIESIKKSILQLRTLKVL